MDRWIEELVCCFLSEFVFDLLVFNCVGFSNVGFSNVGFSNVGFSNVGFSHIGVFPLLFDVSKDPEIALEVLKSKGFLDFDSPLGLSATMDFSCVGLSNIGACGFS